MHKDILRLAEDTDSLSMSERMLSFPLERISSSYNTLSGEEAGPAVPHDAGVLLVLEGREWEDLTLVCNRITFFERPPVEAPPREPDWDDGWKGAEFGQILDIDVDHSHLRPSRPWRIFRCRSLQNCIVAHVFSGQEHWHSALTDGLSTFFIATAEDRGGAVRAAEDVASTPRYEALSVKTWLNYGLFQKGGKDE